MSGTNSPGHRPVVDHVRQLRRRLWVAAKRSPERRFHALLDRIWRGNVLREAWRRVRRNRGAAGVDATTLGDVEQYGVERLLDELGSALRAGMYRPQPVRRRYIPKADGRQRPLGMPTVRDRVAQMAATLVLEPIFEADFRPSSHGFRPKRSATQALEVLGVRGARGGNHVLDADIRDCFGRIDARSRRRNGMETGAVVAVTVQATSRASGSGRTHLRGHANILKRLLVHVGGFNLGLLMRTIVAAALAGHGVFDAVHGSIVTNPGVPEWWPAFCLAFDVTAASAMIWSLNHRHALAKELWQPGS